MANTNNTRLVTLSLQLKDTCTICPVGGIVGELALINGLAGKKVQIDGALFTLKTSKSGVRSEYMLYVVETLALKAQLEGASRGSPKKVEFSFEVDAPSEE